MSRTVTATGFACALAVIAPLAAQNPPQSSQPSTPSTSAAAATVSIQGCLVKETEVPGRRPPDAMRSRTNTDEDYILIDARPAGAPTTGTTAAPVPQPATPTGTSGSATGSPAKYKIKGMDLPLAQHKDKRVQIEGTFDRTDRTNNPDTFAGDLVLLRATAIKAIDGECPAKTNDK